jgi:hypothetical protein
MSLVVGNTATVRTVTLATEGRYFLAAGYNHHFWMIELRSKTNGLKRFFTKADHIVLRPTEADADGAAWSLAKTVILFVEKN